MDVKTPTTKTPIFVPTAKEQANHDAREAELAVRAEVKVEKAEHIADGHVALMEKFDALLDRVEKLEKTTVAIKALEETILVEKTVSLLDARPHDTVIFHVPDTEDLLSEHYNHLAENLKEKLGVRCVLFAHASITPSIISSKE